MPNIPRWRQFKQPKQRAFDAIEEAIQKDIYLVRASSFTKYIWTRTMVENLFENSLPKTNRDFFTYRLRLTEKEQRKVMLLAGITNNNSTIFSNKYSTVRNKLRGHTLVLDEIIRKTTLPFREKEVLCEMLEGKMNYMYKSPEEKKQIKDKLSLLKHKLLLSAIKLHPNKFEEGANKEQLKKEQKTSVFDRYLRFRLQITLETYARQNKIPIEELPYTLTVKEFSRNNLLSNYLLKVFGRIYSLLTFTFPDKFERWQFNSKNKWTGEQGRELFFKAIYSILQKEQKIGITREDFENYNICGAEWEALQMKNFGKINEFFVKEYLRKKIPKKEFDNYISNRKLVAMLFYTKYTKTSLEKLPTDETLMEMDRHKLYEVAKLNKTNMRAWEGMIAGWRYSPKIIDFINSSKFAERDAFVVKYHHRKTRDALESVVSDYLRNSASKKNL